MSRNPDSPVKIGTKYCGGCQPDYDRVALVARIIEQLGPGVEFLPADHPDVSMVLAVQGCPTACADLTPFTRLPVRVITSENQASDFIEYITSLQGKKPDLR
jgi:hypothetical protein